MGPRVTLDFNHCDHSAAASPIVLHDVAVTWGTIPQMSAQEQQRVAKAIAEARKSQLAG